MRCPRWLPAMLALCAPGCAVIAAETFPARPIRLIVPSGAGGVTDVLGRVEIGRAHV